MHRARASPEQLPAICHAFGTGPGACGEGLGGGTDAKRPGAGCQGCQQEVKGGKCCFCFEVKAKIGTLNKEACRQVGSSFRFNFQGVNPVSKSLRLGMFIRRLERAPVHG